MPEENSISIRLTPAELCALHEYISRTTIGMLNLSGLPLEHTKPLYTSLDALDKGLRELQT